MTARINEKERLPGGLFVLQVAQLSLVLAVAHVFVIEQNYGFDRLIPLILIGFVMHALLPLAWRRWFFVLLFPACSVILLGPLAAGVLLALGVFLFLLCHLPVSIWARAGILLSVGIGLAAVRVGLVEPAIPKVQMYFQTQTLPLLGAIFMFRTAIYLYDLRHEKDAVPLSQRLGYFFLFPNICFPLFPVIDYQTYKRTYFDREQLEIYQKGIDWILRGITHLLLYRIVYHYFVPDPLTIGDVAGVGQYVLSSFLLYLRVSGLFHLIIGILCLFGYNLPETHHRYYLAESFTDFWRRINIYWKDFMVKLFYFPMFMALRRFGVTSAMIVATLATFFITWFLHSYQWFWLRGTFPLHPQDMIFWSVLAVLVTANSLYEEKYGRKRRSLQKRRPTLKEALGRSIRTVSVFVIICVLWSFWTSTSIDQWLVVMSLAGTATNGEILVILLLILLAVAVGVFVQVVGGRDAVSRKPEATALRYRVAWTTTVAIALLAIANPGVNSKFDVRTGNVVATITGDQLNTRDQQQLVKGYYEELLGVESTGSMVWSVRAEQPATWRWNGREDSDFKVDTNDMRSSEMRPHIDAIDKGQRFTTNEWGMRDRSYDKKKPANTYRIAMLGSSHTLGAGVAMESTFSSLVEDRFNDNLSNSGYRKVEVLNFATAGDSILRRLVRFQKKAVEFDVDLVVDMSVSGESHLAVRDLRAAVRSRMPGLDPLLLDIVNRAAVTAEMSSEAIENRLGPYSDEILRVGYQQLSLAAKQHGVNALVFVMPRVDDTDAVFRGEWESLSAIAEEAGLPAISLEGVYGPLNGRSALKLASWDWHPNGEGHALLANRIYREFVNLGYLRKVDAAGSKASQAGTTVIKGRDEQ